MEINDGPRHGNYSDLEPEYFLGSAIDTESDGIPSANATGDDDNQLDDEDGIDFVSPLIPGWLASLGVTTREGGYLDAWMDWNDDGDLDDADEHIFDDYELEIGGLRSATFTVPASATGSATGKVYGRFRLSGDPVATYTGAVFFGEVEDYRVSLSDSPLDFGDAPETYEQGDPANHVADLDFCLGNTVDPDATNQPSPDASLDDFYNDDEDGVDYGADSLGVQACGMADIQVSYTRNTSDTPYLDGWVDFDQDGIFDHPSERVIHAHDLLTGGTTFQIHIPCSVTPGPMFARFRMSATGGLLPTGSDGVGEVEDYPMPVVELDYGDLPDPLNGTPGEYPTMFANDGPRHIVTPNCHFGLLVDADDDGQPDADAVGDDLDGSNDDDGFIVWQFPEEIPDARFTVEHAKENEYFVEVGSADTDEAKDNGTYVVEDLDYGTHRFRLKETAPDGSSNHSPEIEVDIELTLPAELESIYPNPFSASATIRFAVKRTSLARIELYAVDGRLVDIVFSGLPAGNVIHSLPLSGEGLPSGTYILRLTTGGHVVDRAVTVVR